MPSVNVYLTFNGNCEEAFQFYRSVFGGEFPYLGRFSDMPPQEGMPPMDVEMGNRIMHVSLPIGNSSVIMGSDTGGEWARNYTQGNNFSLSVQADSRDEADRLFNALSAGGTVTMPMADTFWNSYFGMLVDKFGITWQMSYDEPKA